MVTASARLAQLRFTFRDRRRFTAYVPEQLGEAIVRDARAKAGVAPGAAPLPPARVVGSRR
jgi:hypothetical protein